MSSNLPDPANLIVAIFLEKVIHIIAHVWMQYVLNIQSDYLKAHSFQTDPKRTQFRVQRTHVRWGSMSLPLMYHSPPDLWAGFRVRCHCCFLVKSLRALLFKVNHANNNNYNNTYKRNTYTQANFLFSSGHCNPTGAALLLSLNLYSVQQKCTISPPLPDCQRVIKRIVKV